MAIVKHAGSLIPIGMVVVFIAAYIEGSGDGLTWERIALYAVTTLCLLLGCIALLRMASYAVVKHRPSVFLLSYIYMMAAMVLLFAGIIMTALNSIVPAIPFVPQPIIHALLFCACFAICLVCLTLFFGRLRDWLAIPVDPMPLRELVRSIFRKGGRG